LVSVKTTLDIPDDVAGEVQRRARRDGRELAEEIVQLVRFALAAEGVSDAALLPAPVISVDPATGLPVIHSPPDAPIRSMTAEQFQALIAESELDGDLERAGLTVRH
jgi:hypothetical protein